jgi:hypothetical protein
MARLDPAHSPCRPRRASTRQHPCSDHHADIVTSFRLAQEVWRAQAETATGLHETELNEYRTSNPEPQFKDWLANQAPAP